MLEHVAVHMHNAKGESAQGMNVAMRLLLLRMRNANV
jgi:hypothetical protein